MDIAHIAGATRTLGKHQGYRGLPLRDVFLDDAVNGPGTPAMQTAWFPNPDELAALAAGAPIILTVLGSQHPPVMLGTGELPAEAGGEAPADLSAQLLHARKRSNHHQAEKIHRGRLLKDLRLSLLAVTDHMVDEGDRVYFGSTNQADALRDMARALEDFHWDQIDAEKSERDVVEEMRQANLRSVTLAQRLGVAIHALRWYEQGTDEPGLARDIADLCQSAYDAAGAVVQPLTRETWPPRLFPSQLPPPETLVVLPDGDLSALMFHYAAEDSEIYAIAESNGFEAARRYLEHDTDFPVLMRRYEDGEDSDRLRQAWHPKIPEGWLLAGKWDSEDGPVAWFIRKREGADAQ